MKVVLRHRDGLFEIVQFRSGPVDYHTIEVRDRKSGTSTLYARRPRKAGGFPVYTEVTTDQKGAA